MSTKMWEQLEIWTDFDFLTDYCHFVECSIEDHQKDFQKKHKKVLKSYLDEFSDNEEQYWLDSQSDEAYKLYQIFPRLQRASLFIIAFSFFEKHFRSICIPLQRASKISLKDISAKGIDKYKEFLSKSFEVDGLFSTKEWATIKNYSKLRNTLAHAYGELSKIQHKIVFDLAKKCEGIEILHETKRLAEISIKPSMVLDAISLYRNFLSKVLGKEFELKEDSPIINEKLNPKNFFEIFKSKVENNTISESMWGDSCEYKVKMTKILTKIGDELEYKSINFDRETTKTHIVFSREEGFKANRDTDSTKIVIISENQGTLSWQKKFDTLLNELMDINASLKVLIIYHDFTNDELKKDCLNNKLKPKDGDEYLMIWAPHYNTDQAFVGFEFNKEIEEFNELDRFVISLAE